MKAYTTDCRRCPLVLTVTRADLDTAIADALAVMAMHMHDAHGYPAPAHHCGGWCPPGHGPGARHR